MAKLYEISQGKNSTLKQLLGYNPVSPHTPVAGTTPAPLPLPGAPSQDSSPQNKDSVFLGPNVTHQQASRLGSVFGGGGGGIFS